MVELEKCNGPYIVELSLLLVHFEMAFSQFQMVFLSNSSIPIHFVITSPNASVLLQQRLAVTPFFRLNTQRSSNLHV